jgi:DNA primase
MDPKSAAQVIRDTVSMDQILGLYGYSVKHGFMVCPFHGDRDASLKVYKGTGGWHCYGCGKGGSVIDFVMEHEGCDFRTAVNAIDDSLRLGLRNPHENPFEAERERMVQQWLDDFVAAVYSYLDAVKAVIGARQAVNFRRLKKLEELRDGHIEQISADDWTFLLTWKENDEYDNYRIEKINEFREEVAAWRRKARRVRSA